MGISEQEALAQQLFKIFDESIGYEADMQPLTWERLTTLHRTAWVMVAQFVEARDIEIEDIAMYGSSRNTRTVVDDLMDKYPDHK